MWKLGAIWLASFAMAAGDLAEKSHPRVWLDPSSEATLREKLAHDPLAASLQTAVMTEARRILSSMMSTASAGSTISARKITICRATSATGVGTISDCKTARTTPLKSTVSCKTAARNPARLLTPHSPEILLPPRSIYQMLMPVRGKVSCVSRVSTPLAASCGSEIRSPIRLAAFAGGPSRMPKLRSMATKSFCGKRGNRLLSSE